MKVPSEVFVALADLGYGITEEGAIEVSPEDDGVLWRFLNEMIENSSRADACEQLHAEEEVDGVAVYWYLIRGRGQGETFLMACESSANNVARNRVELRGLTD